MSEPLDRNFFDRTWGHHSVQYGQPVVHALSHPAVFTDPVSRMSNTQKLRRTLQYALSTPDLSAEIKRALGELLDPTNLAITAGVLAAWAASHLAGVGVLADAVVIGFGYVAAGAQAVHGMVLLVEFGLDIINARYDRDLRRAAAKLVRAVVMLGVNVVVGLLTRKAQIKLQSAKTTPRVGRSAPAAPTPRPPAVTALKRHRGGNQQVSVNNQRWHLPANVPSSKIPAADPVGDQLQAAARQAAQSWNPGRDLSPNELAAIERAQAQGQYWQSNLLERQARGRFVESRLKEQFRQLQWSSKGVDVVDPATGIKYDILSGTSSNMDLHAKRMAGEFFRMITF